jgi:uncharacterized membrane protein YebE (DUF533 family)
VSRGRERGGAFGTLVLLIAIGVAGYYAYQYMVEAEEAPSCKAQLNGCLAKCRRTSTEAPQLQACQEDCQAKRAACKD